MGRFYKTSANSQFLDYMFKPNTEMQLAVASKQVESDALKKAFASSAEYDIAPTFKAWQGSMDDEVSKLNESINPIVEALVKDPNSAEAKKQIRNITGNAKELYSSGNVGQMSRHFNEYQAYEKELLKDIDSTKDPVMKGRMTERLNKYRSHIGKSTQPGFSEDWSRRNLNPYIDAQKDLRDNIQVDNMKQTFDYIGKPVQVIKQGNSLVPISSVPGSIKGGKFVTADGKEHDILGTKDDKLKALGLPFQYYRDDLSTEGFMQGMINKVATQRLQNPAFISMLKDDYEMFGEAREGEDFNSFVRRKVQEEASMFSAQHPEITKHKETRKDYKDDYGKAAALQRSKYGFDLGLEGVKNKNKTALAKLKGEIETPQESLILAVPEAIVTPEEQKGLYDKWFNQVNAKNEGGKYDEVELARLNEVFEPVIKKDGDKILRAFGDNPDNYKTEEGRKNRVMKILNEINKVESDSDYGVELIENEAFSTSTHEFTQPYFKNSQERDKIIKAKEKLQDIYGDFNDYVSKNLNIMSNYMTLSDNEEGNRILDILNQSNALTSPSTRAGGTTLNDIDGKRRGTQRIDVDDSMWSTGRGKTLERIMKVTGANNLKDLRDQGYLVAAVKPSGKNETTVLWTATEKLKGLTEIELSDGTDISNFKTTHSNIGNEIFKPSTNPEKNELYLQSKLGRNYDNVKQKLNHFEAVKNKNTQIYEKLYPKGRPLRMAGYDNLVFGIKDTSEGGVKITIKNVNTKEEQEVNISKNHLLKKGINKKTALKGYLSEGIYLDPNIKALNQ